MVKGMDCYGGDDRLLWMGWTTECCLMRKAQKVVFFLFCFFKKKKQMYNQKRLKNLSKAPDHFFFFNLYVL